MNHNIIVSIKTNNKNKLLLKLYDLNINIISIKYFNNYIEIEISIEDYKRINKYLKSYKIEFKNSTGIYKYLSLLKINKIFILNIVLSLILLFIMSNTIISVKVVHSKKYIRDIVTESLKEYGVKKISWKKDYDELQSIKEKILKKYPENIEWLEIEQVGMTYVVKVEERIITKIDKKKESCHIIATKDGMIKSIKSTEGQELVEVSDYVKKGDILISGEIKYNDEIKNVVCANGEVLGEVWYISNVKIPLNYQKSKYTGKKRYNIAIDDTKIFKSRLKKYNSKKKKLFNIFGKEIYLLTEQEINIKNYKYNEKQAVNKALKLTKEKINLKLSEKEGVTYQKVLKKSINNSTMYIEIFTTSNEVISKNVEFQREEKEVD